MLFSVQALRALAAWMVVYHHFLQIFFDFKAPGAVNEFFTHKGAVGVDIFFVISGLVIYLSSQNSSMPVRRFVYHRVIRIVPAYWIYTLAMAALLLVAAPLMPHQVIGWHNFLLSLIFVPSENPGGYGLYPTLNVGWTLNYEMLFYLLFAVTFAFRKRHRPLIVAGALFAIGEVLARSGVISRFYGNDIIYEFLLGIGIGVLYRRGWVKEGLWLPLAGLGVAVTLIYHLESTERFVNWGLPSALLVLCCVSLEPLFRDNRVLKSLGDCSYSVYLIHLLVLYGGLFTAQRFGLDPYVVFICCVPVIAGGAWLSYQWIEKGVYRRMKDWRGLRKSEDSRAALS